MSTYKRKYSKAEKAAYARKMAAARARKSRSNAVSRGYVRPARPSRGGLKYPGAGEAIGSTVGSMFGPAGSLAGAAIGHGAHKLLHALTGFGDYHVTENTLLKGGMSPPQIINSSSRGGFIVRHREYLVDITATEVFTVTPYDINPGLNDSFPWLSGLASCFEEYRFRGLVYEFKSMSSDAVLSTATNSALGTVIMATSYNVLNPPFVSKQAMENYEFANSSKPSCSFYHPIECKKSLTPVSELFVRVGGLESYSDQRLYDMGKFQIATQGQQADGGVIGELWCTYEVEFFKPKFGAEDDILFDGFTFASSISGAAPFGIAYAGSSQNNLGGTVNLASATYTFPRGIEHGDCFIVSYTNIGSATVTLALPTITANGGTTILPFYNGGTYSAITCPQTGATTSRYTVTFIIRIDTPDSETAGFSFGLAGTVPNGAEECALTVSVVRDDMSALPVPD